MNKKSAIHFDISDQPLDRRVLYLCLGIGLLTVFIYMIFFNYFDGRSMCAWSYEVWDAFIDGKPLSYPSVVWDNVRNSFHTGTSSPLGHIPYAIWNFPFWIISVLFHVSDVTHGVFMLWHKLFNLLLFIGIIYRSICIIRLFRKEETREYEVVILLFCSWEMIYTFASAQNELLYYYPMIEGLYRYYTGRRTLFYIFMGWAVLCNPMMFLCYLPVIILEDKNIISIASKMSFPFIPVYLLRILYYGGRLYLKYGKKEDPIRWYGRTVLSAGFGEYSVSYVIITVVMLRLYFMKKRKDAFDNFKVILFSMTIMLTTVSFLGWDQSYRVFLWFPVFVIYVSATSESKVYIQLIFLIELLRSVIVGTSDSTHLYATFYVSGVLRRLLGKNLGNIGKGEFPGQLLYGSTRNLVLSAMIGIAIFVLYRVSKGGRDECDIKFPMKIIMPVYSLIPLLFVAAFCYKLTR